MRSYRADKKSAYAAACIANAQQDARRELPPAKSMLEQQCAPAGKFCRAGAEAAIANRRCAAVLERINTQLSPLERGSLVGGAHRRQTANCCTAPPKRWKTPDARPQKAAQ